MDDKLMNNTNEIEDGEIFSSSDNDDVCEILENNKNITSSTTKTTPFLPTVFKTDIEKKYTGVNKKLSETSNKKVDRKRSHEINSINIKSVDENTQQYIFDEDLNIFIRGGSPITNIDQQNYYESHPLYYDEISCDSDENFDKYSMYDRKRTRKTRKNKNVNDKYKNKHRPRGQRFKNSGSNDSNDQIIYKRKKLCKFFLQNKCYRPSQCVFMHGEFPCKYYYLGLKCPDDKNCKLDHGKPLNEDMKEALLRHIQYAPDECLGNFQKIPSEVADKLFADRAMEFKLNEIKSNKSKLKQISSVYENVDIKKDNKEIDINDHLIKKLEEKDKSTDNNIGNIKNTNQDIFDDICLHMNQEFLNCDTYRMFLDDLNNKSNVDPLTEKLPKENNDEILPTNFNDIDERMRDNLKKSIESENYDDPNLKFLMIQFFLSLNHNRTNLSLNDIPQSLNIENFKEFLTELQIGKLKELGINFVHHLSLLSLANLNSLGISITQISQIQDKSLTIDNVKGTTITSEKQLDTTENNSESFTENCPQVSSTSVDTDMRILPPVYSPDKWSGTVDTDCRLLSPSLDENVNDLIIDEESQLIIDESILSDEKSDISDDDNLILLQTDLNEENQLGDLLKEKLIKDINPIIYLEKLEKINELKKPSSDTTKIKTQLETNDYDTTPELPQSLTELSLLHLIEQNMKRSIKYGDMDMRFPFLPLSNFLPATEINGSINLHEEIEYKVHEILIPEKKQLPSSILVKLEPNHLDPRLRKEYFNREHTITNNNKDSNITSIDIENLNNNNINENNINKNDIKCTNKENQNIAKENLIIKNDTIKFPSAIIGIDPRKRFDNQSQISSESSLLITKNLSQLTERNQQEKQPSPIQFLHFYLQKSHWYNDQNSKRKIEINELIAILAKAIKNYHQENNQNKQFNILNLYCAQKIDEILLNLGIDIDCNGYIVEIDRLTQNNNQLEVQQPNNIHNFNNATIDLIYNNNSNINNSNNSQLYPMRFFKPPPLIPPLVPIQSLSSTAKPGLLGWCPPSTHYYQEPNYMVKSHNPNFQQQKLYTNYFQRNHRKINDRI